MPVSKNFGGRPGRKPDPGERVHLGIRVTPQLKERLERTAGAIGRSQSQEAEIRLERSFERQDLLPDVLAAAFPRPIAGLLIGIGRVMFNAGQNEHYTRSDFLKDTGDQWLNDPTAFDQAVKGAMIVLNAARPPGSILESKSAPGEQFANGLIEAVRNPSDQDGLDDMRSLLGPLGERMKDAKQPAAPDDDFRKRLEAELRLMSERSSRLSAE